MPGFGQLPCPKCGEETANISLDLDDLAQCRCRECEEDFPLSLVTDIIAKWRPVLDWIATAPQREDKP